jgi:tRNA (cytidine/uridine-2'-O-)-methyltransferase
VEPEIPQNTGNIGRTCVGLDAALHLVGELGFSLNERDVKRAGLDYWPKLDLRRHATWDDFVSSLENGAQLHFFSRPVIADLQWLPQSRDILVTSKFLEF